MFINTRLKFAKAKNDMFLTEFMEIS